jgi:hypothetical protein
MYTLCRKKGTYVRYVVRVLVLVLLVVCTHTCEPHQSWKTEKSNDPLYDYDFPAPLTSAIHFSSLTSFNPPSTTLQTSFALPAPKSFPSIAVRYATPARTRTASPSKTMTSHSLVALSRLRYPVKREANMSRRYASVRGLISESVRSLWRRGDLCWRVERRRA